MSNPTSNFGWQMPTATDLVTDLPADFEVFGQAVDTSLADLKGGTTGQILAKNTNTDMDFVWITNDVGDITAVTAGTGISGGGTSGAVTITNSMATEITAKADLIVGTGNATFDNLPVGANGTVLTADSSVSPTGLKWATPSSYTLLSTTSLTGASTTISSISGVYKDLQVVIYGWQGDTSNVRNYLRLNGISTSTYRVVYSSSYQTANYNFSPTSAILTNATNTGNSTNTMVVTIPNYASTAITKVAQFYGFNYDNNTPSFESYNGVASTEISGAITSLVFSRASGNLTAGTVLVYGVN